MAKQKGIVQLTGTLNGLNFYFRKGVPVVRTAGGGFNGKAIKTKPEMVRVRDNASEFGRVSSAKKVFRLGLHPFLKDLADVSLHGRLMRLFQEVKRCDTVSERGQRRFEKGLATDEGKALLLSFVFTSQKASAFLPGTGVFDAALERYTLSAVQLKRLRLPKGASGMQLCLGVLVADFEQGTTAFFKSTAVQLHAQNAADFVVTPEPLPVGTGVRIAVLQVRYYQEVNGTIYLFQELSQQGLEVVGVY